MKRLLLAGLAIACLGIGAGVAQNITKALQLSQDATGSFGVDSVNSVFFPNHVVGNAQLAPTVTSGAGTITVVGTDLAGTITGGGVTTTSGTLTFRSVYGAAPVCVLTAQNPATSPQAYNAVATGINITSNIGAAIINYVCIGNRA